jgi:hypothetical protein
MNIEPTFQDYATPHDCPVCNEYAKRVEILETVLSVKNESLKIQKELVSILQSKVDYYLKGWAENRERLKQMDTMKTALEVRIKELDAAQEQIVQLEQLNKFLLEFKPVMSGWLINGEGIKEGWSLVAYSNDPNVKAIFKPAGDSSK